MNQKVTDIIANAKKWNAEMDQLRSIMLDCQLTEEVKWGKPCYSFQKSVVAIIGGFKDYCALSFFKGVLLQDSHKILVAPGENSRSVRLMKFTSTKEIIEVESIIKAYTFEAMEVEKSGLKVSFKEKSELIFPDELLRKMDESPEFRKAFEALTPGRQRGYNLFFTAAKQSKTKEARIEKYRSRILDGKGFHDCVCGRSKRMPTCDGSHKFL